MWRGLFLMSEVLSQALMEDGHVSRREDAFRKEMSQYRVAVIHSHLS
jgi:hypothetical protein